MTPVAWLSFHLAPCAPDENRRSLQQVPGGSGADWLLIGEVLGGGVVFRYKMNGKGSREWREALEGAQGGGSLPTGSKPRLIMCIALEDCLG